MGQPTAEQAAQRAFDLGLLDIRQVQELWSALGSRSVALDDFLQMAVRREFLTNYQVERLVRGDRAGFFYGPFKCLFLVGSGTFARVYRAVHRNTGERAAIKVLRSRYSENPAQFGQFIREGRLGMALRHPNIVPIYEVVSEGKNHYCVMEFVEGWNLKDFVKIRKKVEPLQATRLMLGMAQGLGYAFEHGLTHRDLKLNNVLVSSDGQAKLVDFGLAAMDETMGDDTASGDMPNTRTIDYAALERATGVRKDDTRSDIFFLGCIFYNMLTGVAPLSETRDRLQRLSKQRFLEITPIQKAAPNLPHWVSIVVSKAMMLEPMRRYQSPSEMVMDLKLAEAQLTRGGAALGPDGAPQKQYSVMVVESNLKMQDILRDGLKKAGYRVLITSDPARAVGRFRQDGTTADCVLFNAQELGEQALLEFNSLGEDKKTNFVRAILLLNEEQKPWESRAMTSEHRVVLPMPVTMKRLRETVAALVEVKK